MSNLFAITYKGNSAYGALKKLVELQKMQPVELQDAAIAEMNEKGKVKLNRHWKIKIQAMMATWGFFWGFLIGLIFGDSVYQTSLSNEDEEKLKKALEHEDVNKAIEDNIDVE